MTVVFLTGFRAEADLLARHGWRAVCSGGCAQRSAVLAYDLVRAGATGLVSFGVAGGLDPALPPGALVVASAVLCPHGTVVATPGWVRSLMAELPQARCGLVAGATQVAATPLAKRALAGLAVDLESAAVAMSCAAAGLPFAVVRAVADPAGRRIPPLALSALDACGEVRVGAVARGLLRRPGQLAGLVRVALDTRAALAALDAALPAFGAVFGARAED